MKIGKKRLRKITYGMSKNERARLRHQIVKMVGDITKDLKIKYTNNASRVSESLYFRFYYRGQRIGYYSFRSHNCYEEVEEVSYIYLNRYKNLNEVKGIVKKELMDKMKELDEREIEEDNIEK